MFGMVPKYDSALTICGLDGCPVQVENFDFVVRNSTPILRNKGIDASVLAAIKLGI
ncbi:MAG: hypothetical protein ACFFDP_06310 [Promethearchaeota archaeon]